MPIFNLLWLWIHYCSSFVQHYCCLQLSFCFEFSFFSLGFARPGLSPCRFVGGTKVGSSKGLCKPTCEVWFRQGPLNETIYNYCFVTIYNYGRNHLLFEWMKAPLICPASASSFLWKVGSSSSAIFLMACACLSRHQRMLRDISWMNIAVIDRENIDLHCHGIVTRGEVINWGLKTFRIQSSPLYVQQQNSYSKFFCKNRSTKGWFTSPQQTQNGSGLFLNLPP